MPILGAVSSLFERLDGAPQGPFLAPLFKIIFTHDLNVVTKSRCLPNSDDNRYILAL
jgi:hypothetical protein